MFSSQPYRCAVSLCCGIVGISIEAVDLLCAYLPLKLAIGGGAIAALTPEQFNRV
jgi:hypothetical protein